MKNHLTCGFLLLLLFICPARAGILSGSELSIDLTDVNETEAKAEWSDADLIKVTPEGLGWDGRPNESRDFWLRTKALPIGFSWRPAQSTRVRVEIQPADKPVSLPSGINIPAYPGQMFVRHSPDLVHWSSWQAMEYERNVERADRFRALVAVPRKNRKEYVEYMQRYRRMDVAWKSDAEGLVKWIIRQEPDFFEGAAPFVGYLQFLWETSLHGQRRIKNFHLDAGWGVSGLHVEPKDPNSFKERWDMPWRYKGLKKIDNTSIRGE